MKEKDFDFKHTENKWKAFWEKEGIFKIDFKKKINYSIDTPPPTVSGKMHIGHAFSYAQQDFIARFRRMVAAEKKESIFYPFGTDDNGLPTEKLIEKINKVKSKEMSRADFIELCVKTLKKITPSFIQDWKDLGMSCDFEKTYSTIDDNSRKLSQKFFIELYNKKKIYKKEFPTLWCPDCQTSIAQAELEDREEKSLFSTLKFSSEGQDLLIATTRPEMLEACVTIFVNPKDKRYKKLIGKKAKVPLFNFEVPIIADKSADMEKGTGVLMVCSYGDKFDVDAINRYKLKPKLILDKKGFISKGKYNGMFVKKARKEILKDLEKANLISEQKEINHVVNCHDKCGTPIEFITTEQWFIKILEGKSKWIELGNKVKWHPEFMKKRYDNWVNGLEWDWGISRERHFGIPIPIWYCGSCNEIILPNEKELPIDPLEVNKKCPKCRKDAEPESKVLDTWVTSSLTPQITSSLFDEKVKIPFSLRPNAHDIIRTWAFYTIVRSYLHEKKIPWNDIIISGVVSLKGEKMSKSKGNVIEPKEILDKYGADALRFWAAGSKLGSDLDYQEKDLVAGTKMINKLRNATKFVFMNLENYDFKKPKKLEKIDEEFLIELDRVVFVTTSYFKSYEYSRAKSNIEEFFWKFFCDFYLETVKKRVYNEKGDKKRSAQYTLYKSLLGIIKMLAPITPFITEEIYQEYFKKNEKDKSIHSSAWPEFDRKLEGWDDEKIKSSANEITLFVEMLSKVRSEKTKAQKPMNAEIILTLDKSRHDDLVDLLNDLKDVTNAKEIKVGNFKVKFTD